MQSLTTAFQNRGVNAIQVIPWKIARTGSTNTHRVATGGKDLTDLDLLLVLDLGATEIGAFFNRVGLLSALAESGVEIINSVSSILLMRNKAETMRKLISAGLPVPETLITESIDIAVDFLRSHTPCVLKPITGFGGQGVQLVKREFDLENIHDYLKIHSQAYGKGAFLLQEYIENPGYDVRALVVEGEVIATMKRIGGEGITRNIHAGGLPRKNDIDVAELAIGAAKSVRGRLVGVDIIPDLSGQLWVLEANATPGWSGLQQVTDFDISDRIAGVFSRD